MFRSFYCCSYDCWDEEAGSGEEEILLVTDVLKLIGNGAQMMLHCRNSAGTVDFCLENSYKLGQQGSSLALWVLSLYSGVCPYSYADLMKRFQWLRPQARLHGIKKNPDGDRSRAEF